MGNLMLVAFGGAAGAMARYLTGLQVARLTGGGWPAGTLAVNVVGGFAMGVLAALLAQRGGDQERWRLLLGVGVLGGFTTFSAYSLEVAQMIERRALLAAFAYAAGSSVLCVAAVFAGLALVRRLAA